MDFLKNMASAAIIILWFMFWLSPEYLGHQTAKVYFGWAKAYNEEAVKQIGDGISTLGPALDKVFHK